MTAGVSFVSCKANMTVHQLAESLGNAIDAKDSYTCSHSEEVAVISHAIGVHMGLGPEKCEQLHIAGHLHDIGKIGIPDSILLKKGHLTDDEFRFIQKHPQIGADIIAPVTTLEGIDVLAKAILHHHERYDGKGYPHGLKGSEIPLEARIISVADTLSAMASNRPYRKAVSFEEIVSEITRCSGTQFDPAIVNVFVDMAGEVEQYFRFLPNQKSSNVLSLYPKNSRPMCSAVR